MEINEILIVLDRGDTEVVAYADDVGPLVRGKLLISETTEMLLRELAKYPTENGLGVNQI